MTAPFDSSEPTAARIYDYWPGGEDYFEADRKAQAPLFPVFPALS